MDHERERIQADLRGHVKGEVRCDDVFLQLYAGDASIYEVRPLGVVRPRSLDDVVAVVQYAAENGIPLHPRGAGTGLAGESLGPGLVIDFSRHMRRILHREDDHVRVQPGVVYSQLNRFLAAYQRQFGPDPATGAVSTLGGAIALDASGSRWPAYGSTRRHVRSLQVVLADGTVAEVNRHRVPRNRREGNGDPAGTLPALLGGLGDLLERHAAVIREHQPKAKVNRSGYHLPGVLQGEEIELAKLLVGSEGTLALVTEATLETQPLPAHRGVALLFFDRLENAARGAQEIAPLGASACDLMDRRLLTIAREAEVHYDLLIPPGAEAMLLVEFEGEDRHAVQEQLSRLVDRLQRRRKLAFESRVAHEPDEVELFWRLPRQVVPTLYRLKGSSRPLPFVEDIAVPPEALPEFLVQMQDVLKRHQVTASLFSHAGHGQIHLRPFLNMGDPDDVRRMQLLAVDLYEQTIRAGGTISGEHGDGLSRTWYVPRQYGPLYAVFREVKRLFDPQGILNPGKVVAEAPQPLTANLRAIPTAEALLEPGSNPRLVAPQPAGGNGAARVELQLAWREVDLPFAARNCNGCGRCRSEIPSERMCPLFRIAPGEEATPRAKANLVRGVLTGTLSVEELSKESLKEIADLCIHCHQCRLECPANVDIPKLMVETKGQYTAVNGLTFVQWLLARPEVLAAWGSRFPRIANWMLGNRRLRWLMEKLLGLAQGRKVPRLAARNFLRQAVRRRLTRPTRRTGRKVVYFVDTYANWFDTELAEALVAVMEHNGVSVFVHPAQQAAGMPLVAIGAVDHAKQLAARNVAVLAEAVRQGYHVVATEPSAALCLTHEYPNLLDDDEARLVARNTSDAASYLWRLHQEGRLELDLRPIHASLGYHLPCHMAALTNKSPGEHLLRLVPGLKVERIEQGCSGMAGMYGLAREHYRTSLRIGWGLISAMRRPEIQAGVTECSTCRVQMEQGTSKPTIHPLKILALSYGLMPQLAGMFNSRSEDLYLS